jgi:hypothetical protein
LCCLACRALIAVCGVEENLDRIRVYRTPITTGKQERWIKPLPTSLIDFVDVCLVAGIDCNIGVVFDLLRCNDIAVFDLQEFLIEVFTQTTGILVLFNSRMIDPEAFAL